MKYKAGDCGLIFSVQVQPRASRSAIVGVTEEWLRVCVTAPPVSGKANEELILLFSKLLDLPKSRISITAGKTSRRKVILLEQFPEENFRRFLNCLEKE